MRISLILLLTFGYCLSGCDGQNDSTKWGVEDRVAMTKDSIGASLKNDVLEFGAEPGSALFIRAFKMEKRLEVWLKKDSTFGLFRTYPICYVPGRPGPKRKQGDNQVPEGIYYIDRFNPESNFHLSMRVNYPNESDLYFADPNKPGGEIYIHGNCVSIGCIPIGDSKIEELYLLALDAADKGQQNIPVHIFPCRLEDEKLVDLIDSNFLHRAFWENLQPVYEYFERARTVPNVKVDAKGRYEVQN